MKSNIENVLDKLKLEKTGSFDNQFYIIQLADSNEYAKMYSKLEEVAINLEEPYFDKNKSGSTTKVTTYFEVEVDGVSYLLFLIGNFVTGSYYLKIGEK